MDLLRVTQLHPLGAVEVYVIVDGYVPLQIRTHREALGVFWQELGRCRGYSLGRVSFLIADGTLAGVWFTRLTETETRLFESQAGT